MDQAAGSAAGIIRHQMAFGPGSKRAGPGRGQSGRLRSVDGKTSGGPGGGAKQALLAILLLLGSFAFAFCTGEAIHEIGHFLARSALGAHAGIRLDPFGGSMILAGAPMTRQVAGITSLAGPLFNLLVGMSLSLAIWRFRKPALLPLLLWGPVALIQEGVTFSLGMLTPMGDADLMVRWGIPAAVLVGLGVLFFALGIALICRLLPLVNLMPEESFGRKFGVVAAGMVSFMVLRLLVSLLRTPGALIENAVPLVFSLLLAVLVSLLYKPLQGLTGGISRSGPVPVRWRDAATALALAAATILFQVLFFN